MNRLNYKSEDVKDKILKGIDTITDPIKQTLGPKGRNILYENDIGEYVMTNDGVTIAKQISVEDRIENAVIEIIKDASLKTNLEAGDGTSTTVLLASILIKEGLKLTDEGYSWLEIRDSFIKFGKKLKDSIEAGKKDVKIDADIRNIAKISANNDEEIADYMLDIINTAGETGFIFLEPNHTPDTEIIKDLGFMMGSGLMFQELLTNPGKLSVNYKDVPVLMTDKRIYYPEEAETILRLAVKQGWDSIVVVARDFIGDAVNTFITNHKEGVVKVLLVKDEQTTETDTTNLQDLAVYLGGKIVSEKTGSLVNKITPQDFVVVNSVFSDRTKTLFTPKVTQSKELKERIKNIQTELKEDPQNNKLKTRLAALTTGIITVKIGGNTRAEVLEKIFRYEDAINATRAAMKEGYVVGGGLSFLEALDKGGFNEEFSSTYKKYCEAVTRQIAENCGKHPDTVLQNVKGNMGYNALTDTYEDLMKSGIIAPYLVIRNAIENSISVANIIISLGYYLINDIKNGNNNGNKSSNSRGDESTEG